MQKFLLYPVLFLLLISWVYATQTTHLVAVSSSVNRLVVHVAGTDVGTSYDDAADYAGNSARILSAAIQSNMKGKFGKITVNDGSYYTFTVCPYSEDGSSVRYDSDGTLSDDCNYTDISDIAVDGVSIGNNITDSIVVYTDDNRPVSTSTVLTKETELYCTGMEIDQTFQVRIIQWTTETVLYPYYDSNWDIVTTTSLGVAQDWVRPTTTTNMITIPYTFDTTDFSQGTVTVRCESIGLPACQADGQAPCVVAA